MKNCLILCAFVLLSLYSCSGENKFKIENTGKPDQKISVIRGNSVTPVLEAMYKGSPGDLRSYTVFIDKSLARFYKYLGASTVNGGITYRIPYESDNYRLFYSIGLHLLSYWKNDLLKYGVIEMEWEKMDSGDSGSRYFRISDVDDVLKKYRMKPGESSMLNAYAVNFLLKEISFVSIQEFLSRPERYFNQGELDSVFTRMTVIPESEEFTLYILKKFGKPVLLSLAESRFSNDGWSKMTDEKINETEGAFSRNIENYNFNGIFTNSVFTNELYGALKLYNKNTKKTLFRK
ncbi:MAG: hypothetical protein ABSG94_04245 [Brevinematales bacterium]